MELSAAADEGTEALALTLTTVPGTPPRSPGLSRSLVGTISKGPSSFSTLDAGHENQVATACEGRQLEREEAWFIRLLISPALRCPLGHVLGHALPLTMLPSPPLAHLGSWRGLGTWGFYRARAWGPGPGWDGACGRNGGT